MSFYLAYPVVFTVEPFAVPNLPGYEREPHHMTIKYFGKEPCNQGEIAAICQVLKGPDCRRPDPQVLLTPHFFTFPVPGPERIQVLRLIGLPARFWLLHETFSSYHETFDKWIPHITLKLPQRLRDLIFKYGVTSQDLGLEFGPLSLYHDDRILVQF